MTVVQSSSTALQTQLEESVTALHAHGLTGGDTGIVLGTGLGGGISDVLADRGEVSYGAIPHLPHVAVEGHAGRLSWDRIGSQQVLVFEGRVHCYEGYSPAEVAYTVRLMAALGVKRAILTNIAGGLNPDYREGDLMLISDHINLMGVNPLVGANEDWLGPRFPDMSEPYGLALRAAARAAANEATVPLREGVYVGVLGPNLETRAEYRFLRMIGADAVGMSTIPEVIAAVHAGLQVLALSLITDRCIPETLKPIDVPKILQIAREADPVLSRLLHRLLLQPSFAKGSSAP